MSNVQGAQSLPVSEYMENKLYDTAGTDSQDSQSSYVSSSGIKAVLLNAWNAVKSAVSGMLSCFGLHLSEQQGSDKPGRTMTRDRVKTEQEPEARPLPPAPGPVPEDDGEHVYESMPYSDIDPGRARTEQELKARSLPPKPAPGNVYESMPSDIDPGRARTEQEPEARPLSPAPVPEDDGEHVYETMPCGDINPDRVKTGQELTEQELKARPLPPIPEDSDDGSGYSDINFYDGNEISEAKSEVLPDKSASESIYATVNKNSPLSDKGPIYATVNKHSPLSDAEPVKINEWEGNSDGAGSEAPPVLGFTDRTPLYTQIPEDDSRG